MDMKSKPGLPKRTQMQVTSFEEQRARAIIHEGWEPNGFERFQLQRAWLREMPIQAGLSNTERQYRPATSCQDTLDCTCGNH